MIDFIIIQYNNEKVAKNTKSTAIIRVAYTIQNDNFK